MSDNKKCFTHEDLIKLKQFKIATAVGSTGYKIFNVKVEEQK